MPYTRKRFSHHAGGFDLVTCIEVVEHIPAEDIADALDNLTALVADGGFLIFSSTPTADAQDTHLNVQPKRFWLKQFQQRGFTEATEYNVGYISRHAFALRKA